MRATSAVAVFIAIVLACSISQTGTFAVVSGPGFEGAIIPASQASKSWMRDNGVEWTPTAADVRESERALLQYLQQGAQSPERANPPIIVGPTTPPRDVLELRALINSLPNMRRQYLGIGAGRSRQVMVIGFPKSDDFKEWDQKIIQLWLDVGCAIWFARFDLTCRRIISFNCSGSA